MNDAEEPRYPSDWLIAQLPALRTRLGLSAQQLADRLAGRKVALDRAAISKIETGRRGVSLDEVLALAVVLGVAPLHLFLPLDDDASVALTPTVTVPAVSAREWVRGREPLPGANEKVFRSEIPESEWERERQPSEQEREARAAWESARRQLRVAETLRDMRKADLDHFCAQNADRTKEDLALIEDAYRRLERKADEAYAAVAEARVAADEAWDRYRRSSGEKPLLVGPRIKIVRKGQT